MHEESIRGRAESRAGLSARKRYRALRQSAFEEAGSSSHVSYPVPDGDGGALFFSYRQPCPGRCRISSCFGIKRGAPTPVYDEKAVFADIEGDIGREQGRETPQSPRHARTGRGHNMDRLACAYEACATGGEGALREYAEAVSSVEPSCLLPYYARLGLPVTP